MKKLKKFESFVSLSDSKDKSDCDDINIILDISGSMSSSQLEYGVSQINRHYDVCDSSNITLIQVGDSVESVDTFNNLDEIMGIRMRGAQGGSNLQAGIDYVVDNDLGDLKTFIISDFYTGKIDYSGLIDYEEIRID